MSASLAVGLHWLALFLAGAAGAAALGAVLARSLFAMCLYLTVAGALSAACLLALNAGEGALALVLVAAAWAPILLLAAMLLSSRAAKPRQGRRRWLTLAGAGAVAGAAIWAVSDLGPAIAPMGRDIATGLGFWLAPLLLVPAAGCIALLGYGERGALARDQGTDA
jgi:hypothetical protein